MSGTQVCSQSVLDSQELGSVQAILGEIYFFHLGIKEESILTPFWESLVEHVLYIPYQ